MDQSIETMAAQYQLLAAEEQRQLVSALSAHLGKTVVFSTEGLSGFRQDEMEIVWKMLLGHLMTKEYVPDIRGGFKLLREADLPSRLSFGRVKDSETR